MRWSALTASITACTAAVDEVRTLIDETKPVRLKELPMSSSAPHTSDSLPPPPASKMPTTRNLSWPIDRSWPSASDGKRPAILAPTITSPLPGSKSRPSVILKVGRTWRAAGPTPRTTTFDSLPSLRLKICSTIISPEASGWPPSPRSTWGRAAMVRKFSIAV